MQFQTFHNPDISWPVVRRRAADEFLTLLMGFGEILLTRGHSLTWNQSFPSDQAYWSALSRLRRSGLVVSRCEDGGTPRLTLTDPAKDQMPIALRPERSWSRRWDGRWYVLIYDVPERDRHYRDTLRRFLTRMRMGCLQKSVWITPDDIRPAYADLKQGAAAGVFSFLMESQTVLGQSSDEIVCNAWPFDRLAELQSHYCRIGRQNLALLKEHDVSRAELTELANETTGAYLAAMEQDPMLPQTLHPTPYYGRQAYALYRKTLKVISSRL